MNTEKLRQLMNLCEGRNPDLEYEDTDTQVIAKLASYNSQVYTKLAQSYTRMVEFEAQLKAEKETQSSLTKEAIANLFETEDRMKTCIVETKSVILTISKEPKATETPQYKKILEELAYHLTPELLEKLEELKKIHVTVTQKSPSLRIEPLKEGLATSFFARLKNYYMNWANQYDQKLNKVKRLANSL
jgi:hypothetical protein